ncbi:hypothetical protein Hanom_Chr11g01011571 [Helianthus anomalus]
MVDCRGRELKSYSYLPGLITPLKSFKIVIFALLDFRPGIMTMSCQRKRKHSFRS